MNPPIKSQPKKKKKKKPLQREIDGTMRWHLVRLRRREKERSSESERRKEERLRENGRGRDLTSDERGKRRE